MDATPSRSDRRDRARRRNRTVALVGGAAVLVAVIVGVAVMVAGGGTSSTSSPPSATGSRATKVGLTLGDVAADSAGAPVTVSTEASHAVLDQVDAYVHDATVVPLRSGAAPATALASVFDASTLATATTADRGALFDEGMPKVTGSLTITAPPISVLGLGDQSGKLTLVIASMVLDVKGGTAAKDPLHIVRKVDFTLAPDATGAWKVTAYDVVVTRDGGGLAVTATTQASK